jgi:hypothetical protein
MVVDGVDKLLRRYPDSPIIEDVLGTLDADEIRLRVHELEPETADNVLLDFDAVGNDARGSGLAPFAEAPL